MEYIALIDIGCIECGEISNVIGVFEKDTFDKKEILKKYGINNGDHYLWGHRNWHGQHNIQTQKIKINEIYKLKEV